MGRLPKVNDEILVALIKDNDDFTHSELATILGVRADTITRRLKKLGLQTHHKEGTFICKRCHNSFDTYNFHKKICDDCKHIQNEIYFEVRRIRYLYHSLLNENPRLAQAISDEMEAVEGRDFRELAINGLAPFSKKNELTDEEKEN